MISGNMSKYSVAFVLFSDIVSNKMKFPAKKKAGCNGTDSLNLLQLGNFYLAMKMQSRLLKLIVVVFSFCKKSEMSIIKLITCKVYKYLINQVPIKVNMLSFCESGCSSQRALDMAKTKFRQISTM